MDLLARNNPGARFVVLYRPIEEIAESWEARAKNPNDPWRSERGVEVAVETWNAAMRKTREFIEGSPTPGTLIVTYHDFFYRNEAVVSQISRFLGLEFDESITGGWRDISEIRGREAAQETAQRRAAILHSRACRSRRRSVGSQPHREAMDRARALR
jgi:hypothetical protein